MKTVKRAVLSVTLAVTAVLGSATFAAAKDTTWGY